MPEVIVPVGPQHPALKEPVNFKVIADGETIVRLELDVSYNHRGIEKAAEARDFVRVVPLLERVCGICSHSHTTVFVKGIEEAKEADIRSLLELVGARDMIQDAADNAVSQFKEKISTTMPSSERAQNVANT